MKLFNFFRPAGSAPVARERLQILLEYERKLGSHVDLIAVLREEILEVLSRHVTVDSDKVQITVDRGAHVSALAVDIVIPNSPRRARGRHDADTLARTENLRQKSSPAASGLSGGREKKILESGPTLAKAS